MFLNYLNNVHTCINHNKVFVESRDIFKDKPGLGSSVDTVSALELGSRANKK